jgi:hypothetical protein
LYAFLGAGADINICVVVRNEQKSHLSVVVNHRCVKSRQTLLCAPVVHLDPVLEKLAADLEISSAHRQE